MGLLTDPSAGQGRLGKFLASRHRPICVLMWLGGIVWFCCLAHSQFNAKTYFSENALLPGLVRSEVGDEVASLSRSILTDLLAESSRYPDKLPYPWLLAKMRQLGLEPYEHNFTLKYPLGNEKVFTGKNVYGVLRAPRAASTETIILSAPYRTTSSLHITTLPGIAAMLAFAQFARKQKYWAKDMIFLITEHEMLGAQAWLEAYHGVSIDIDAPTGEDGALRSGELPARGGAIQAALNLEIHDLNIGHLDVKVEGLNGQLPNLDLVNIVHRICSKEGIKNTFKHRLGGQNMYDDPFLQWWKNFEIMMSMVLTQATGAPNGNHGLFHRYGIEAVTLEAFGRGSKHFTGAPASPVQLSRVLEGLCRSLNNLLERFHQSYFFYLLPSSDRFVSIGYYMPALGLIAGSLLIKSFALWLILQQKATVDGVDKVNPEKLIDHLDFNMMQVGSIFLVAHLIGILLLNAPIYITKYGLEYFHLSTDSSLLYGYTIAAVLLIFSPYFVKLFLKNSGHSGDILNILALLELATLLLAVGMQNFSMALLAGSIIVPITLFISPKEDSSYCFGNKLCKILWVLLQPLCILIISTAVMSFIMFPEETVMSIMERGVAALKASITYGIVDSIIYGNWAFNIFTAILVPNWLLFWQVLFIERSLK